MFPPDCDGATLAGKEFAKTNGIRSTKEDNSARIILSLIDIQVDFVHPATAPFPGNLSVPGAVEDLDRVCQFIFRNVGNISHIFSTLDTHYLFQCFHRFNWLAGANSSAVHSSAAGPKRGQPYQEGEHPDPFTIISLASIRNDTWRPARLPGRMLQMVERLESQGNKNLCIWPLHCELGTPGHALCPSLSEAMHFHGGARNDQYDLTEKGMSQSAEHYGALRAEVAFDDDPLTQLNTRVINKWQESDLIIFAGQAKSHCMLATLDQAVDIFQKRSPELLKKLVVLKDCMSSVPDIIDDSGATIVAFNQIAEDRFAELEKLGVRFVNSTEPISI